MPSNYKIIVKIRIIFSVLAMFYLSLISGQDLSSIKDVKVDELSDTQVKEFWKKAQARGHSLSDIIAFSKARGMPEIEAEKLRSRIKSFSSESESVEYKSEDEKKIEAERFGLKGRERFNEFEEKVVEEKTFEEKVFKGRADDEPVIFGMSFFNNPKISFEPNINVPTPKNYILGPGDAVEIDLWGAAEVEFSKNITKEGFIRLPRIGVVHLDGLTLEKAKSKIRSRLRRLYSGISLPKNSPNKVFLDVRLSSIRTVQVNIIGEVVTPGTYSLSGFSTVLNGLYAAGGPNSQGTLRNIKVYRMGKEVAVFDVYKYILSGSEKGNIQLHDQDIVIVSPYLNRVELNGELKRNGIFELKNSESFNNLVDYAGGFTAKAYKKNIIIERSTDTQKEIKEFNFDNSKEINLKNGDKISVKEIIDRYKNRVFLEGAVYHPGNYEFYPGMTVKELLNKGAGIKDKAYQSKADIIRKVDELNEKVVSFSLKDALNGSKKILLQNEDKVYVYSKDELREERVVEVNGAVISPKKINYMESLTVEDAIALTGGFKEGADNQNIEISRRLDDRNLSTISETFIVNVNKDLSKPNKKRFFLKPFDILTVRYKEGFSKQKTVQVLGEVKFPGYYSLKGHEDRVSDILKRAGGVTPYAYVEGATVYRKNIEKEKKQVLKLITERDTLLEKVAKDLSEFKVGIELDKILEGKKKYDFKLKEGDKIEIPKLEETVEVQGMVFSPSLVKYEEGRRAKHYIDNAGGFSHNAKKNKVYVVYKSGKIAATKNFLFFRSYPKLKPGATILIPEKPERKKLLTTQEIIGLTTGFATLGILLDRLIR